MKERVVQDSHLSVKEIFLSTIDAAAERLLTNHPEAQVGAPLPTYDQVSTILQKARSSVRPPLPSSRAAIELGEAYTKTTNGQNFLLFNEGTTDRILGFSTNELIIALCNASTVFMDGTFRVVPEIFSQLYTLHGFYKDCMIPMAYFLLPNKDKDTYKRMFGLLKTHALSLGLTFNPPGFQLDFESSALLAIKETFPSAHRKGCFFHFTQCIWRKVQKFGLQADYKDPEVKRLVRSIGTLALTPLERLDEAWMEIDAQSPGLDHPSYEKTLRLKQYFIETWMENDEEFPRSLWNHYGNFSARTTNHLEGWHRALNRKVGKSHVNLFVMIEHLQKQERKFRTAMLQLRNGAKPPRPCKKYVDFNDKLRKFVEDLESDERSLIDYIKSAAFILPM